MLPFILFAFVASITPGPTNILVLSSSSRYGFVAALPIILGGCGGAATLVLVVGLGVGETLVRLPTVQTAMSWLGALWLSYLAWQIFSSSPSAMASDAKAPIGRRLGLLGAASLQLVNPKTWMMALAVVGVFSVAGVDQTEQVVRLSLVFFLVSIPCLGFWACVGLGAAKVVRSARGMRRFNQLMALLLLVSAWMSLVV